MPVHPAAAAVKQYRPTDASAYRPADSSSDGWWQRDQAPDDRRGADASSVKFIMPQTLRLPSGRREAR